MKTIKDVKNIKIKLTGEAKRISKELNGAPVLIIVAGSKKADMSRCLTGYSHLGDEEEGRLRDIVGILETAKQIEVLDHFPMAGTPNLGLLLHMI